MLLAGILTAQCPLFGEEKLPETVQFNRDIRPVLSNKCFTCHGPDEKRHKGKLRLDVEAEAKATSSWPANSPIVNLGADHCDTDELVPPPKPNR